MLRLSLQGWQSLRTWSWILRVAERLGKIFFCGAKTIASVEEGARDPVALIVKWECSRYLHLRELALMVFSLQASTASCERTFLSMNFFHGNFREITWGMRRSSYLCEHSVNWEKAQKGARCQRLGGLWRSGFLWWNLVLALHQNLILRCWI